jgi:hypothetical protein
MYDIQSGITIGDALIGFLFGTKYLIDTVFKKIILIHLLLFWNLFINI